MIDVNELGPKIIIYFGDKLQFHISEVVIMEVILAVIVAIVGLWMGSNLQKIPKGKQVLAEALVGFIYSFAEDNVGKRYARTFAPYLGSLIVWLVFANSTGLYGLRPITADINVTAGLAALSFLLIEGAAIKQKGIIGKIQKMGDPYYPIAAIHLISECVLPMTLCLRLFGNIFGGMVVIDLWMHLMEYLSYMICDFPFLRCLTVMPLNCFFDIFEPLVQAYIFTILTAANLGEGLESVSPETAEKRRLKKARKLAKKQGAAA